MRTIGRYEIKSELGRGGMAVVYRAIDPNIGREVALKLLPQEFANEPGFISRFQREVRTVGSLHHPAIVPLYDADEQKGQPYLVMRLMAGGSLLQRLKREAIAPEETVAIYQRLAGALDEAHGKGIIHRDLKPGNILLDEAGQPYLSDFGIVKLTTATSMTSRGSVGTPAYMSPEHFEGNVCRESDVYAMGVILYQMLTGRLPFQAQTPPEWMKAHFMDTPDSVRTHNPSLPPSIEPLLERVLAKRPDERPQSVGELADALAGVFAEPAPATAAETMIPEGEGLWLTSAGGSWPIKPGTTTLGRSSVCDVEVNDSLASREHARLLYDGAQCTVYDAGSANGTFINNERVGQKGVPFVVGDQLRLGETTFGLQESQIKPVAVGSEPQQAVDTRAETAYRQTKMAVEEGEDEVTRYEEPVSAKDSAMPPTARKETTASTSSSSQKSWLWLGLGGVAAFIFAFIMMSGNGDGPQIVQESSTSTPAPPTNTPQPAIPANMVHVPAGEFTMGSENGDSDEKPVHTVYVEEFYIDQYEVTNEEYAEFLNGEGNQEEGGVTWLDIGDSDVLIEERSGQYQAKAGYGDHPVVEVTWYGARAYCEWAGKRLPTDAEWEKAARGTDGREYPWGNESPSCERLQYDACNGRTVPVGSYEIGKSPYGVYDMAGNVWEWTLSAYEDYPYNKDDDRNDLNKNVSRVVRGGSWYDLALFVRTANRYWYNPTLTNDYVGFRCLRSP